VRTAFARRIPDERVPNRTIRIVPERLRPAMGEIGAPGRNLGDPSVS
jgi:hypothetical protein